MFFVDVILPIPVEKAFTYKITEAEYAYIKPGMRLAVPFGKSKVYTGLAIGVHQVEPQIYEAKEIEQILDESPLVTRSQLAFWQWIAKYYMCTVGEVMRAALPSAFLLESETVIRLKKDLDINDLEAINDEQQLILDALSASPLLKIHEVMDILDKKRVLPVLNLMVASELIELDQEIYEAYKPKLVKYVRLNSKLSNEEAKHNALDSLSRAPKQRKLLLTFFSLKAKNSQKHIKAKTLQEEAEATLTQIKTLCNKEIFELYEEQRDRVGFEQKSYDITKALNPHQEKALEEIQSAFSKKDVCLLHGVTSSGKTEIYVNLIEDVLNRGEQVLYLLPEIALTTQLVNRLKRYFGDKLSVFHSKFSVNEQVEVWHNVLHNKPKAQLILGARSSLLLPFYKLGLVVVDEEHEPSYKQYDPAPRYHARDAAVVLANGFKAKILMGSATPSLESYYNAQQGKYALVTLRHRHGNVLMPESTIINIQDKYRRKKMTGHFSDDLLRAITDALDEKEQVILFQNRRGYSPILECTTCGHSPQCPNCDVSLTYHKHKNQLRCHYCGYHIAMQIKCMACGSEEIDTKGFGTEQIENELKNLYPDYNIGRMDSDTTRGKYGFEKIISAFEQREIDVLVGTQMLTKGLDFGNVSLVGVLNADSLLNMPDFRAHERSFQMVQQVSGRAGRSSKRGKVLIQSYNPHHQILQQVSQNNYEGMFKEQLEERYTYKYPPFLRLIKITFKHKDYLKVEEGAIWFGKALKQIFGDQILGPEPPPISRIRNEYYRNLLIKIPKKQSLEKTKKAILKIQNSFKSISTYRSIKIVIDVDTN